MNRNELHSIIDSSTKPLEKPILKPGVEIKTTGSFSKTIMKWSQTSISFTFMYVHFSIYKGAYNIRIIISKDEGK